MASRYGTFSRSARSAFYSTRSSSFRGRPATSNTRPPSYSSSRRNRHLFENQILNSRRRWAESLIPLHNAVASAKLVSHLGFNSRSSGSLSLGFQGFVDMLPLGLNTGAGLWPMRNLYALYPIFICHLSEDLEDAVAFLCFLSPIFEVQTSSHSF